MLCKSIVDRKIDPIGDRIIFLLDSYDLPTTNCFHAALFVHNLWNKFQIIDESMFLHTLHGNFEETVTPRFGDVVCLTYNNGESCQHAFVYFTDTIMFEKFGPEAHHKHQVTTLNHILSWYTPKLLGLYRQEYDNQRVVSLAKILRIDPRVKCFRRKQAQNTTWFSYLLMLAVLAIFLIVIE